MRRLGFVAFLVAALVWSDRSFAYRPFDSTDAAVVTLHEAEIELGPAQYLQEEQQQFLVVPGLTANVGVLEGCELVVEGRNRVRLGASNGAARVQISDAAFSIKNVIRPGSLQEKSGPSVATEIGALLPATGEENGLGGSAALIVSQRTELGAAHLNGGLELTRAHNTGCFAGLILEGPSSWPVRPVAELFVEREFAKETLYSGLVGAIWRAGENLAFDAAFRRGVDDGATLSEVRAGLTWSFEL